MILSLGYVFGSEDQARVYTAEIVSAVSHLHMSGIVHRDLKPENILMDADGHVIAMLINLKLLQPWLLELVDHELIQVPYNLI